MTRNQQLSNKRTTRYRWPSARLRKPVTVCVSLALLLVTLVGCASSEAIVNVTVGNSPTDAQLAQALERNQSSDQQLSALRIEIEPKLQFDARGAWTLAPGSSLSPDARDFVQVAQSHLGDYMSGSYASVSTSTALFTRSSQGTAVQRFWWGIRLPLSHDFVAALTDSWSRLGGTQAVKQALPALGLYGWAATAAGAVIPAYFEIIKWNDRSTKCGANVNISWTLITVVSPRYC